MKKILRLILPPGLVVFFFVVIISLTGAARASSNISYIAANITMPEQDGPPWLDQAWSYRRAVVVSNPGTSLLYYQVLIKLDSDNFDFEHAKPDGSDIRIAHADGTTELRYWIEAWDNPNELAYVWVRVPFVSQGDTPIYLYYGNPGALSTSDGNPTFDGFDDNWSQFNPQGLNLGEAVPLAIPSNEISSSFIWDTFAGTPAVSAGELRLDNATGIKSKTSYQNIAVGMRANFGSGGGNEWGGFIDGASGQRTMIRDIPSDPNNLYISNNRTSLDNVLLPRVDAIDWHNTYHIFEVRWSASESAGDADHGASTTSNTLQVPNTALPVTLYNNNSGAGTTLKVDWVYVRQYRDPEPTASVKAEQGLVALSIAGTDAPDPIRPGVRLTYQLTIANNSSIAAPDVVITDTLPASAAIAEVSTSLGWSCDRGSIVYCTIPIIGAYTDEWVTVVVTPTDGGWITNTVSIGSAGYEMDLSDNYSQQTTLVDDVAPSVDWTKPVGNDGFFITYGGLLTLGATASDDSGIARVEFRYYDHIQGIWITIGSDNSYPYQVQFDSSVLAVNQAYQAFVVAVDKAGNASDPVNPLRRIFIERKIPAFLPLLRR